MACRSDIKKRPNAAAPTMYDNNNNSSGNIRRIHEIMSPQG